MRSLQWLVLVSAALFIGAIVFVVAAERRARTPPAAVGPATTPVATIKQVMTAIVQPNAMVVYEAVGSTSTAAGVVEFAPKTDEDWRKVTDSAAALAEAGNLLLLGNRVLDDGEWVAMTRAFIAAARASLEAAEARNASNVFMVSGDITETCDRCHARYQRR